MEVKLQRGTYDARDAALRLKKNLENIVSMFDTQAKEKGNNKLPVQLPLPPPLLLDSFKQKSQTQEPKLLNKKLKRSSGTKSTEKSTSPAKRRSSKKKHSPETKKFEKISTARAIEKSYEQYPSEESPKKNLAQSRPHINDGKSLTDANNSYSKTKAIMNLKKAAKFEKLAVTSSKKKAFIIKKQNISLSKSFSSASSFSSSLSSSSSSSSLNQSLLPSKQENLLSPANIQSMRNRNIAKQISSFPAAKKELDFRNLFKDIPLPPPLPFSVFQPATQQVKATLPHNELISRHTQSTSPAPARDNSRNINEKESSPTTSSSSSSSKVHSLEQSSHRSSGDLPTSSSSINVDGERPVRSSVEDSSVKIVDQQSTTPNISSKLNERATSVAQLREHRLSEKVFEQSLTTTHKNPVDKTNLSILRVKKKVGMPGKVLKNSEEMKPLSRSTSETSSSSEAFTLKKSKTKSIRVHAPKKTSKKLAETSTATTADGVQSEALKKDAVLNHSPFIESLKKNISLINKKSLQMRETGDASDSSIPGGRGKLRSKKNVARTSLKNTTKPLSVEYGSSSIVERHSENLVGDKGTIPEKAPIKKNLVRDINVLSSEISSLLKEGLSKAQSIDSVVKFDITKDRNGKPSVAPKTRLHKKESGGVPLEVSEVKRNISFSERLRERPIESLHFDILTNETDSENADSLDKIPKSGMLYPSYSFSGEPVIENVISNPQLSLENTFERNDINFPRRADSMNPESHLGIVKNVQYNTTEAHKVMDPDEERRNRDRILLECAERKGSYGVRTKENQSFLSLHKENDSQIPLDRSIVRDRSKFGITKTVLFNTSYDPEVDMWWYQDTLNLNQGPFTALQLVFWIRKGIFDSQSNVCFRRDGTDEFLTLLETLPYLKEAQLMYDVKRLKLMNPTKRHQVTPRPTPWSNIQYTRDIEERSITYAGEFSLKRLEKLNPKWNAERAGCFADVRVILIPICKPFVSDAEMDECLAKEVKNPSVASLCPSFYWNKDIHMEISDGLGKYELHECHNRIAIPMNSTILKYASPILALLIDNAMNKKGDFRCMDQISLHDGLDKMPSIVIKSINTEALHLLFLFLYGHEDVFQLCEPVALMCAYYESKRFFMEKCDEILYRLLLSVRNLDAVFALTRLAESLAMWKLLKEYCILLCNCSCFVFSSRRYLELGPIAMRYILANDLTSLDEIQLVMAAYTWVSAWRSCKQYLAHDFWRTYSICEEATEQNTQEEKEPSPINEANEIRNCINVNPNERDIMNKLFIYSALRFSQLSMEQIIKCRDLLDMDSLILDGCLQTARCKQMKRRVVPWKANANFVVNTKNGLFPVSIRRVLNRNQKSLRQQALDSYWAWTSGDPRKVTEMFWTVEVGFTKNGYIAVGAMMAITDLIPHESFNALPECTVWYFNCDTRQFYTALIYDNQTRIKNRLCMTPQGCREWKRRLVAGDRLTIRLSSSPTSVFLSVSLNGVGKTEPECIADYNFPHTIPLVEFDAETARCLLDIQPWFEVADYGDILSLPKVLDSCLDSQLI